MLYYAARLRVFYPLSLHDALPIFDDGGLGRAQVIGGAGAVVELPVDRARGVGAAIGRVGRSEEHTSELQSRFDLVCRLLLEKKKEKKWCEGTVWETTERAASPP